MREYIATQGERLDQIIYREYKTLNQDVVNKVLEVNSHLLNKIELEAFDKVYLPDIVIESLKEDKTLW
ncbi:hypothetical protein JCM11957_06660 [Caminibacter profundus]